MSYHSIRSLDGAYLWCCKNFTVSVGLSVLLLFVAIAVDIFIFCGYENAPYEFLDKEPFQTAYGMIGMIKENQKAYRTTYAKFNILGTCICVVSPVAFFIMPFSANDF